MNLGNFYFPESKLNTDHNKDGLLVGFKFESFFFVITSVIPLEQIKSIDSLSKTL